LGGKKITFGLHFTLAFQISTGIVEGARGNGGNMALYASKNSIMSSPTSPNQSMMMGDTTAGNTTFTVRPFGSTVVQETEFCCFTV